MCENWDLILKEYEKDISSKYLGTDGKTYTFIGLVHASDDYYYGMVENQSGKLLLCSCVGSLTGDNCYGFIKL